MPLEVVQTSFFIGRSDRYNFSYLAVVQTANIFYYSLSMGRSDRKKHFFQCRSDTILQTIPKFD